jgi:sigma-B regulation protein RsbU (phosphoserine phosphatase)
MGRPPAPAPDAARLRAEVERLEGEAARLAAELDASERRAERELAFARSIQLALVPSGPLQFPGWEVTTSYRPARSIGGDFLDVFELTRRRNRLDIVVADVSGKGLTAALVMAFCRAVTRTACYNGHGPADALERTNSVLVTDARTGRFVSAWIGELNLATGSLRHATAGHEPPLIARAGSRRVAELPGGGGRVVGAFRSVEAVDRRVRLREGDVVVAYTDGVTDALDRHGHRFGLERLRRAIRDAEADRAAAAVLASIAGALERWTTGVPPTDDIAIVVVRRTGSSLSRS